MDFPAPEPSPANGWWEHHAALLIDSHRRLTGRELAVVGVTSEEKARHLYQAPFVVLSHDGGTDPVFTYANLTAQRLFALPWERIVGMPSRYSAEAPARKERQRLLAQVARFGYIDDYQGVRIASTGERFLIRRATVWNLLDADGKPVGQAASFAEWTPLPAGDGA
ncbi:MAG: MEKHLA domain-containing protein [Sterolibacteriaceae bacterium MAG5]|nr:MEKHLA domain-containing protein [Candidatus Nitricoxidireducens bremensis]